ncbi:MAG: hypothetical protein SPL21_05390 [Fibrobacter sp.]|nr:hypothetical protein [Fibrobacter sp.]
MIRYFLFLLFLVPTVHAITCTEGLLMYYKDWYGLYLGGTDAILDSTFFTYDGEFFRSEKILREKDYVRSVVKSNEDGIAQTDTTIQFYLVDDLTTLSDRSIASKKNLGDTVFIETLISGTLTKESSIVGSRTTRDSSKIYKDGVVLNYSEFSQKEGEDNFYLGHIEVSLKNDTLFNLHLGSEDGAPMDTASFEIYVADPNDKHICHEFYRVHDCEDGCTDSNGNPIKDGDIVQSYDHTITENKYGFMIEEIRHNGTNQYFMIYSDETTTSIAKRPLAKMNRFRRDFYFDTKGRTQQKTVPYRVFF